jgi:hypothetical protein
MSDRSKKKVQARLDAISDYLARIGSKGGKVGGKASGPRKARSPEQYKAMAAKSAEARKAKKKSRLAAHHNE